ncbi:type II toxin-antitoxin system ParD family antitoxin [Sphingomonas nostoxanthinifaciens]|uniref:type II toxin-antitoxin system ParD family antitoxin n=1 Tax=Sphingomonas nostoxanthinifaciens TaxID=2872652 RepID=UPI001CC1D1E6|nr:type II toxin-antitoxin system ParD family antitoxin [Sphingomonas nostoxanthinifaciens]
MSATPTRNVALTRELDAYIQAQVSSGRYSSSSEVVRSGLRLLMERDEVRAKGGARHAR